MESSSQDGFNTSAATRDHSLALSAADVTQMLRGWAQEIENDGTPSQVGPTAGELRAVSSALAIALNGLDAIGAGRWNNGSLERRAARDFARRAREAAIGAALAESQ